MSKTDTAAARTALAALSKADLIKVVDGLGLPPSRADLDDRGILAQALVESAEMSFCPSAAEYITWILEGDDND